MKVTHAYGSRDGSQSHTSFLFVRQMVIDQRDRLSQLVRRHAAVTHVHVFQSAVVSDELDREPGRQRVSIKTTHHVRFVQLVQERHRYVTDMFVSETDLRS